MKGQEEDNNEEEEEEEERQVPIDPVSLKHFGMLEDDPPLSVPAVLTEFVVHSPKLPPLRTPRFISASLPCSATSSPVYSFPKPTALENSKETAHLSPRALTLRFLARQQSSAPTRFASTASKPPLGQSKSCVVEGRRYAAADDFDILSRKPKTQRSVVSVVPGTHESGDDSFRHHKPAAARQAKSGDQDFKCGALCLFLPGFSKKKQVAPATGQEAARPSTISKLASLEKFECGSWSSSFRMDDAAEGDKGLEFPTEMARCSAADDMDDPVKMAFVFTGSQRGILKKNSSLQGSIKSREGSNRHVRFSESAATASCPTSPSSVHCVTPRLHKAREEFNAFLAAQNA